MGEPFLIALVCLLLYLMRKQHNRAMRAEDLRRVAEKTLEEQARNLIHREGYSISKDSSDPFRISTPDCDGDREVLFRGKYRGDDRMKIAGDSEDHCYALVWRGEGTSYIGVGW